MPSDLTPAACATFAAVASLSPFSFAYPASVVGVRSTVLEDTNSTSVTRWHHRVASWFNSEAA